jgi:uncharacterized protein (TIGR03437 family)
LHSGILLIDMFRAALCLCTITLTASALLAQSPCSSSPNLNVTGTWYGYAGDGVTVATIATLSQSGSTWSGTYSDTPITGHSGLMGTLSGGTINGNAYNANLTITEGSLVDTGSVMLTLSADGNTLSGTYSVVNNQTPPGSQSGAFTLVRVPPPVLAPATVTLTGTPGGMAVQDTSSLSLYNCGGGPIEWTASATSTPSGWLAVGPPNSGTLQGGSSIALTLTATPGNLTASGSPYTGTVTVSPTNAGDFSPISSTVQFSLSCTAPTSRSHASRLDGCAADSINLSGQFPKDNANLEVNTTVEFSVNVSGTLNSAPSGTIYMQIVDGSGNQIGSQSDTMTVKRGVPFNQTLTTSVTISSNNALAGTIAGTLAGMEVVFQPQGGTENNMTAAAYTVYPHAKLLVATGSSLWQPPATPPEQFGIVVGYTQGSPDRGTAVNLTAINNDSSGTPAASIPPVDVSSGTGYYAVAVANPVVASGSSGIAITADLAQSPAYLDSVAQTTSMAVQPAPSLTNFQWAGSDGNFVPASQSISLENVSAPLQPVADAASGIAMHIDYSGAQGVQAANWIDPYDLYCCAPTPRGNGTIKDYRDLPTHSISGMFLRLSNFAGQTVDGPQSATATVEEVAIEFDSTTHAFSEPYVLGPGSSLVLYYIDPTGASSPLVTCAPAEAQPHGGLCLLPFPIPTSAAGENLKLVAAIVHADGSFASKFIYYYTAPETFLVAPGSTASIGPVAATFSGSSTSVTAQPLNIDPSQLAFSGSAPAGPTSAAVPRPGRPLVRHSSASVVPASDLVFLNGTINFSPSIPDDGTFTTNIVYQYSSAVLPDDPGFNPRNLELVSFDPSTLLFSTYPSTVNTSAQTVSATVGGLAPYYALAVPASTLGSALNLPVDLPGAPAPAIIGLLDAGTGPANISVAGYGLSGAALEPKPVTTVIVPGQPASAYFASLDGGAPGRNWIQAYSSAPGTVGAALLTNATALESLPLTPGSATQVLSGIQLSTSATTEIDVANTTPFENDVTLELHDTTGAIVDQFESPLPAKGSLSLPLGQLFTKATAPLQGYVLVRGSERLSAAALTFAGSAVAAMPGQSPFGMSTTLYAADFQDGPNLAARLDIVNPGSADAHVTIQANKDDGTPLGGAINATIAATTQYWIDLGGALGLGASQFTSGSISVSSDVPGLVGDVTFGDASAIPNYLTSIPLAPAQTLLAIPYVLNTTALPMTLYALNTGSSGASANVTLYGPDGSVAGTNLFPIPAGGRLDAPLSTLFPLASPQTGGAIQISSTQALSAAGLIYPAAPNGDWAAIVGVQSSFVPGTGPTPLIGAGGITNAAVAKTTLARGGLATIYGSNFTTGGNTYQAQSLPLPLSLGGVFVTVGGIPAPLYYVNSTQINFQVPFEVPEGSTANVVVTVNEVASASTPVAMADYALGVFSYYRTSTAYDPIIVHYKDNSIVTPTNPAVPGEILLIYATGIGKLNNPPASGVGSPSSPLASAVDTPTVTVGGAAATVLFAGLTPDSVGLVQFDVTLPMSLPSGSLPVVITFPNDVSPTVNLYVQGNQAAP